MKKFLKFILKQFIKCFVLFFVSSLCFYCCTRTTAHADYTRQEVINVSGSPYKASDWIDVSNASSITVDSYNASTQNLNNFTYAIDNGIAFSYNFSIGTPIDTTNINSIRFRVAFVQSGSVKPSDVTSLNITINYIGSDPDIGTASYEQRYNTDYIYSDSFTRSLTERVIFTRWYPDDLFPNMNSIEVNGSTVGNDQLQFRISYISNGVIIGSSAWFDSGFKMPISDQVEYDYLSIALRLPDENDSTGLYDLQPSELDLCVVTVGYRTKVYMSLEPADEIPLTTQDFSIEVPTIDYDELDTANINGFDDYITVIAQATSGLLSASGIMPFAIFLFVLSVIFFFLVG